MERLERGCVRAIRKEHFTYLYSRAREEALTSRNIRAGWAKASLFPFKPEKVLSDIPKPPTRPTISLANEARIARLTPDQVKSPRTPVTPISVDAVASLHDLIKQDAHMLDEQSKQRLQKHVQKLTNATKLSFAERTLLQEHVQFLAEINNEAKVRRAAKSNIIGTARVICYEDLENARTERAAKESKKEAATAARKAKKAKKVSSATPTAEKTSAGEGKRSRKRKRSADADAHEPQTKIVQMSGTQAEESVIRSEPWRAPVARMW